MGAIRMTLSRIVESPRARSAVVAALIMLAGLWIAARFFRLNETPPGFWMDEAWAAAHALCLSERGLDADGQRWPMFSSTVDGGNLPFTWTVFDVFWIRVFGSSRGAFRAAAAFWNLVTCLALWGFARAVRPVPAAWEPTSRSDIGLGRSFPLLVAFAALLSPWSFQYSRISWEGPLAPAFLSIALWCLARLWRSPGRFWWGWAAATGAAAGLSMISYPPLRVTTPLTLGLAAAAMAAATHPRQRRRRFVLKLLPAGLVGGLTIAPIALMMARGQLTSRMMGVAIFAPAWLDEHRGSTGRVGFFLLTLVDNLFAHLRPSYLFITGDGNPRHSAQLVGQLSPVDTLAVGTAVLAVLRLLYLAFRQAAGTPDLNWPRLNGSDRRLWFLAALTIPAGLLASLPAALTWESLPHSLRSIGAWPFVVLFTGAVLALAWRRFAWFPMLTLAVALVYSGWYLPGYFRFYRNIDPNVFHRDITEAIAAGASAQPPRSAAESLRPLVPRYGDQILRYFLMHHDHLTCDASRDLLLQMRQQH